MAIMTIRPSPDDQESAAERVRERMREVAEEIKALDEHNDNLRYLRLMTSVCIIWAILLISGGRYTACAVESGIALVLSILRLYLIMRWRRDHP